MHVNGILAGKDAKAIEAMLDAAYERVKKGIDECHDRDVAIADYRRAAAKIADEIRTKIRRISQGILTKDKNDAFCESVGKIVSSGRRQAGSKHFSKLVNSALQQARSNWETVPALEVHEIEGDADDSFVFNKESEQGLGFLLEECIKGSLSNFLSNEPILLDQNEYDGITSLFSDLRSFAEGSFEPSVVGRNIRETKNQLLECVRRIQRTVTQEAMGNTKLIELIENIFRSLKLFIKNLNPDFLSEDALLLTLERNSEHSFSISVDSFFHKLNHASTPNAEQEEAAVPIGEPSVDVLVRDTEETETINVRQRVEEIGNDTLVRHSFLEKVQKIVGSMSDRGACYLDHILKARSAFIEDIKQRLPTTTCSRETIQNYLDVELAQYERFKRSLHSYLHQERKAAVQVITLMDEAYPEYIQGLTDLTLQLPAYVEPQENNLFPREEEKGLYKDEILLRMGLEFIKTGFHIGRPVKGSGSDQFLHKKPLQLKGRPLPVLRRKATVITDSMMANFLRIVDFTSNINIPLCIKDPDELENLFLEIQKITSHISFPGFSLGLEEMYRVKGEVVHAAERAMITLRQEMRERISASSQDENAVGVPMADPTPNLDTQIMCEPQTDTDVADTVSNELDGHSEAQHTLPDFVQTEINLLKEERHRMAEERNTLTELMQDFRTSVTDFRAIQRSLETSLAHQAQQILSLEERSNTLDQRRNEIEQHLIVLAEQKSLVDFEKLQMSEEEKKLEIARKEFEQKRDEILRREAYVSTKEDEILRFEIDWEKLAKERMELQEERDFLNQERDDLEQLREELEEREEREKILEEDSPMKERESQPPHIDAEMENKDLFLSKERERIIPNSKIDEVPKQQDSELKRIDPSDRQKLDNELRGKIIRILNRLDQVREYAVDLYEAIVSDTEKSAFTFLDVEQVKSAIERKFPNRDASQCILFTREYISLVLSKYEKLSAHKSIFEGDETSEVRKDECEKSGRSFVQQIEAELSIMLNDEWLTDSQFLSKLQETLGGVNFM